MRLGSQSLIANISYYNLLPFWLFLVIKSWERLGHILYWMLKFKKSKMVTIRIRSCTRVAEYPNAGDGGGLTSSCGDVRLSTEIREFRDGVFGLYSRFIYSASPWRKAPWRIISMKAVNQYVQGWLLIDPILKIDLIRKKKTIMKKTIMKYRKGMITKMLQKM